MVKSEDGFVSGTKAKEARSPLLIQDQLHVKQQFFHDFTVLTYSYIVAAFEVI